MKTLTLLLFTVLIGWTAKAQTLTTRLNSGELIELKEGGVLLLESNSSKLKAWKIDEINETSMLLKRRKHELEYPYVDLANFEVSKLNHKKIKINKIIGYSLLSIGGTLLTGGSIMIANYNKRGEIRRVRDQNNPNTFYFDLDLGGAQGIMFLSAGSAIMLSGTIPIGRAYRNSKNGKLTENEPFIIY